MANLRDFSAGNSLMQRGQSGDELFIVIDGELVVWIDSESGRKEIARLTRGDVVGEMGLFQGQRSADVEVASDARLLGIDGASMERLRKRYPRVAAVIYRNLGEILAGRVTSTTERLRS